MNSLPAASQLNMLLRTSFVYYRYYTVSYLIISFPHYFHGKKNHNIPFSKCNISKVETGNGKFKKGPAHSELRNKQMNKLDHCVHADKHMLRSSREIKFRHVLATNHVDISRNVLYRKTFVLQKKASSFGKLHWLIRGCTNSDTTGPTHSS
jgi:hypothetical protein